MSQFGGTTTIGLNVKLILLDCFETMVELAGATYRPRLGIVEFLTHFGSRAGIAIAVISDAQKAEVDAALNQAGLMSYVIALYHAENASESLGGGRARKCLNIPVSNFQVTAEQTLFIGDSPLDAEAAQYYGVQFIRVPRSEDRSFSFATLITGPSRYRSQEFNVTFMERYHKKDPRP